MKKRKIFSSIPSINFSRRHSAAHTCDIAWTSLTALQQSADGFPPLKSVVGGVLSVWDVAEVSYFSVIE